jgi:hypothetical protein
MGREPCSRCQPILSTAGGLRHKRLGKLERRLLVLAVDHTATGGDEMKPMPIPPRRTNKEQTAQRRAVRSLQQARLLVVLPDERRIYDDRGRLEHRVRFLAPMPLGRYVVQTCRRELVSRAPVLPLRWAVSLPRIKRAALDECGCLPPDERDRFT